MHTLPRYYFWSLGPLAHHPITESDFLWCIETNSELLLLAPQQHIAQRREFLVQIFANRSKTIFFWFLEQFRAACIDLSGVTLSLSNLCQNNLQAVRAFDLWGMNCLLPGKCFSPRPFNGMVGQVKSPRPCPLSVHLVTNTKKGGRVRSRQSDDSWNRLSQWTAVWDSASPPHTASPCLQPNSYKSPLYFHLWLPVTFRLRHRTQFIPQRGESTWDTAGRTCRDWSNNKLQWQSEHLFDRFSVSLSVALRFWTYP